VIEEEANMLMKKPHLISHHNKIDDRKTKQFPIFNIIQEKEDRYTKKEDQPLSFIL
jgi:hypothetical protein